MVKDLTSGLEEILCEMSNFYCPDDGRGQFVASSLVHLPQTIGTKSNLGPMLVVQEVRPPQVWSSLGSTFLSAT